MDAAFNEKCADEAMRRNELLAAAKATVTYLKDMEYALCECGFSRSAKRTIKCRDRLEAAIKAEEGAK